MPQISVKFGSGQANELSKCGQEMQNWDDFRFVLALANAGSMALAAKYLNTDATTVSRRVTRLSAEYGLSLFRKTKGSWVLTNAGERFVAAASQFDAEVEKLKRKKDGKLSGHSVTLNTTEFIITDFLSPNIDKLAPVTEGFHLTMTCSDKRISLAYGEADIALRLSRPIEGRLIGSRVGRIGIGLYAPPDSAPKNWVGLTQDLDWTPEMQMALQFFGKPPDLRLPSFVGIRTSAAVLGWAGVGPHSVMLKNQGLVRYQPKLETKRDVWTVIHETRRDDISIKVVKAWVKECF